MKKIIRIGIYLLVIIVVSIILKNMRSNGLKEYKLLDNEKVQTSFKYRSKEYVLTSYYDDKNTYADNNILLKDNKYYYYIDKIEKCDMSYYINKNNIYIHCIGKEGNILKYSINDKETELEILDFDYTNTPNISQIHIQVDKVDKEYVYLKSAVKMDDSINEGEKVKCSIDSKICEYY